MKYIVRYNDYLAGLVEEKTFGVIEEAIDYANKVCSIFGSWNVEICSG